jgi:hypothetical protein
MKTRIVLGAIMFILLLSSGGPAVSASTSRYYGTATFAEAATETPRYIFPFTSGA